MSVVLVNPPAIDKKIYVRELNRCGKRSTIHEIWPQTDLAQIAAVLENNGIETKIIDCIAMEYDIRTLIAKLKKLSIDFLVFMTTTTTFQNDVLVADALKKEFDVKIGAVGQHVTALPKKSLESGFDFVVVGEPENSLLDLAKKQSFDVPGIWYLPNKRVQQGKQRQKIKDLDTLPLPLRKKLPNKKYVAPLFDGPYATINTSRGCVHNCKFCRSNSFYGSGCRQRSVDSVVDEIETTAGEFGISNFVFLADTFTQNRKWVADLCRKIIRAKLDIEWACNSRTDTFNRATGTFMKSAGCKLVTFGVESGNQEILNKMRKGTTLRQNEEAVKTAKTCGLATVGHFILGYPGETYGTIIETIEFAKKIRPSMAIFYYATPYPGTELFKESMERKWLQTMDWSKYDNVHSVVLQTPFLSAKKLAGMRQYAMRQFYCSNEYLKELFMKDLPELKMLAKTAIGYLLN